MLIQEVSRYTHLTKKAIAYYIRKGLVSPVVLENGYRDFTQEDMEVLKKIYVLRGLGINVEEMKGILQDSSREALQKTCARQELKSRQDTRRNELLRDLALGKPYAEVELGLQALELQKTLGQRMVEAFPGYYGRFVCMHFSRFLEMPVCTEEQQEACEEVIEFLDQMPPFKVPKEVEEEMAEAVSKIRTDQIGDMLEDVKRSMEEPEEFLEKNQEIIQWYLAYRQTEAYQNSSAGKWMACMKEFQSASGYTDVFLPAMKKLSPSYREYCEKMKKADEKLLERYPGAGKL